MVGMLQIITYLLCVYLVFKGIEIFQVALMSSRENRKPGLALGAAMVLASVVFALGFSIWITQMAESVSNQVNRNPFLK